MEPNSPAWSPAWPDRFLPGAQSPLCLRAQGLAGAEPFDGPPAVLVVDGEIAALGAEALAAGAVRRDLPGVWLSPAPLDAHVHLHLGGGPEAGLKASAWAGLAAVRDLGHRPDKATPVAGRGAPVLVAAGPGLGAAGEAGSWLAEPLAGAGAFARAARQRIARGCGVIKLFGTGLLDDSQAGQVRHPLALGDQEVAAAVGEAHKAGRRAAVHASGEAAVNQALEQGVDCLEHGFFLGRATLARMAERGMWWSPTLAPVMAHAADPQGRHDPAARRVWAEIARLQKAQVKLGAELGVRLVLGSDAGSYGVPHGQGAFLEMAAWLEAGVPPATVFAAATRRAARVMGLERKLGGIFVGARAWLLGARSDPRRDPLQLARPVWRSF